jgi:L-methionine (R)-S-oxide reductase
VTGAFIVHENVQIEPVRAILAESPLCYLREQSLARALVGSADDNSFDLHRAVLRQKPLEDRESSNLSKLILRHDIGRTRIGDRLEMLVFWPGANHCAELRPPFQGANLRDISSGCGSKPHPIEITPLCYLENMSAGPNPLLTNLERIVATSRDRRASLEEAAALIRSSGNYRWVGLYDVDHEAELVRNVTWSGPGAPEYPTFPLTKGLTSTAVAEKQIVNVGDVSADARYLTAFGSTRSEMIVPVFDAEGKNVVGTIDVESEQPNAFNEDIQKLFEGCSLVIRPLFSRTGP